MPEVAGYGAQANFGSILPDIPEMNPVWVPMNNAIEIALRGDKSVEAALADAVKIIEQNIAELK
jgi:maltose-binding protein MalE